MKKKLNISIDETLLEKIDRFCEEMGLSRSGFMSVASGSYLQQTDVLQRLPEILAAAAKSEKE